MTGCVFCSSALRVRSTSGSPWELLLTLLAKADNGLGQKRAADSNGINKHFVRQSRPNTGESVQEGQSEHHTPAPLASALYPLGAHCIDALCRGIVRPKSFVILGKTGVCYGLQHPVSFPDERWMAHARVESRTLILSLLDVVEQKFSPYIGFGQPRPLRDPRLTATRFVQTRKIGRLERSGKSSPHDRCKPLRSMSLPSGCLARLTWKVSLERRDAPASGVSGESSYDSGAGGEGVRCSFVRSHLRSASLLE